MVVKEIIAVDAANGSVIVEFTMETHLYVQSLTLTMGEAERLRDGLIGILSPIPERHTEPPEPR